MNDSNDPVMGLNPNIGCHKHLIYELCVGENITVRRFVRYNLGEGLQKKEENFAEEIAKATGKA